MQGDVISTYINGINGGKLAIGYGFSSTLMVLNLIFIIVKWGIIVYLALLMIKALKIYINNNENK